jgi:hypothetical protein
VLAVIENQERQTLEFPDPAIALREQKARELIAAKQDAEAKAAAEKDAKAAAANLKNHYRRPQRSRVPRRHSRTGTRSHRAGASAVAPDATRNNSYFHRLAQSLNVLPPSKVGNLMTEFLLLLLLLPVAMIVSTPFILIDAIFAALDRKQRFLSALSDGYFIGDRVVEELDFLTPRSQTPFGMPLYAKLCFAN